MSNGELNARRRATGGAVALTAGAILTSVSLALIVFAGLHRDSGLSMTGSGIAIMIVGAIMRRASLKELHQARRELGAGSAPDVRVNTDRVRAPMREDR